MPSVIRRTHERLDAYTAARKAVPSVNDPRLRIEHAQLVRKQDVGAFQGVGCDRLDAAVTCG